MWKLVALLALALPLSAGTLTVASGTLDIPSGTQVALTASAPPIGQVFDQWTGDVAGVADIFSTTTTVTMGTGHINLQATFKPDPDLPPPPPPPVVIPRRQNIPPSGQTDPVPSGTDDADDMAIWHHPTDLTKSLIVCTAKASRMLIMYNLDGSEVQRIDRGSRVNNVDLRYNFPFDGGTIALVGASSRDGGAVEFFKIDATGLVTFLNALDTDMIESNGFCMYKSPVNGKYYAFVSERQGGTDSLKQFELTDNGSGGIAMTEVRALSTAKAEGLVADDETANLFVGEERVAAWVYGAEPDAGADRVMLPDSSNWRNDIEGLCIYHGAGVSGYVLVSAQGWSAFAVYDRVAPFTYRGYFRIYGGVIGSVSGTDGIEVTGLNLGPNYPCGMFVAQDESPTPQRFKMVKWDDIADSALNLIKDKSYDPR